MRRPERCSLGFLLLLAFLVACDSRTPPVPGGTDLSDPTVPETWVEPRWSPAWWFVLADVSDFVGPERWSALDTAWMEEAARTDLAEWGPSNQNPSEHMLSGLWRLGLLREEVLAAIAELDREVVWPLRPGRSVVAWRPRIERWLRTREAKDPKVELWRELKRSFDEAVTVGDPELAGRVVLAYDTWLGRAAADSHSEEARALVRKELASIDRNYHIGDGLLVLLEFYGIPDAVDLEPVLAAVRRRYRELADETVPLPTPYDLHLACLRLERLMAGR